MISLPLLNESSASEIPTSNIGAGPQFWRTLDELADSPEFHALVAREFPSQAERLVDSVSRRQFLALMGASFALAGISGCGRERSNETIVPGVQHSEGPRTGLPRQFATAMPMPGGAFPMWVTSREGRPINVEGNDPIAGSASSAVMQASVLGLYDPDRAQSLRHLGRVIGWNDALAALQPMLIKFAETKGAGFALLTPSINSPTLAAQISDLLGALPEAKWYVHEPVLSHASSEAALQAFGERLDIIYDLTDKINVVVALDSDFLSSGPNHLSNARNFTRRRKLIGAADEVDHINRLYVVEPMPTPTGSIADERLPLKAGQVESFARALAQRLGVISDETKVDPRTTKFLDAVVAELMENSGHAVVVVGPHQPVAVHLLAHAINEKLNTLGIASVVTAPIDSTPESAAGLTELAAAIDTNQVQTLLILSCNPIFTAPAGLDFATKFQKVPTRIKLGLYEDETAALCHWIIPEAHFLESWSDARSGNGGIATIIQPLIAPLYDGKTAHEVIAAFSNQSGRTGREIIEGYWRRWYTAHHGAGTFDEFFRKSLHDGRVSNSDLPRKQTTIRKEALDSIQGSQPGPQPDSETLELILRPDPYLLDGRFANNGWLQELPKPVTKLVWDNAAIMSPATAASLGIKPMRPGPHGGEHGEAITELVEIKFGNRAVIVPASILPGVANGTVILHDGFGRTRAGRVGNGVGANTNLLREHERFQFGDGLQVRRTGQPYTLGCTQMHYLMENRDLVRAATVAQFKQDPSCQPYGHGHARNLGLNPAIDNLPPELYTNPQVTGQQWGMVINLSACNGCHACVAACQAENNIPVVGKENVNRGREMHWLRIDRYFSGDQSNPEIYHQPVPCMHCENAPCEVVCPVEATTHSPDGLNEMTYNRCVGTRYCANNCPYKVRRFNFLEYTNYADESMKLLSNPQVSVRSRGVMEKCTYCVQRIRNADITAKNQQREVADGEIVTACQAACPAEAITFGNINDPKSKVHAHRALPRNYGLLTELNTKPRTTYLAAVRNPSRKSATEKHGTEKAP